MAGIQTGLTDAQLLASQLKAHELAGMNSSASEIDESVLNTKVINYEYKSEVSFDDMTQTGGDLSTSVYASKNFINISSSQLDSITAKTTTAGSINISVYSIDNLNNVTILHKYASISAFTGINTYKVSDNYLIPEGSFLGVSGACLYYTSSGEVADSYRIAANTSVAVASKVKVSVYFNTKNKTIYQERALTLSLANSLYLSPNYASYALPKRSVKITASSKIKLYGDSISSKDYTWYKDSMESLTGAIVDNGGYSGANAASLCQSLALQTIYDYSPNIIICLIGANDIGYSGTVGSFGMTDEPIVPDVSAETTYSGTYFIQAISYIMQHIKNNYYNIRTRAALTGTETEAEKTAKIDALLKPLIVFATPIPQKRVSSTNPYSNVENQERKRMAIIECCIKHDIIGIDLYKKLDIDMSQEPYWTSPTDKTTNNGIYMMDGLHPNKYGYQKISEIITSEIII